jgi:hypothetical protein
LSEETHESPLGHSKISTTLEVYTLPIPEQQRTVVEKLAGLMASDGKNGQNPDGLPLAYRFSWINGRPEWTRTIDLYGVKVRLTHTYNNFHVRGGTAERL